MIDADNLKVVNDTYGHAKGDYVIQQIANNRKSFYKIYSCFLIHYPIYDSEYFTFIIVAAFDRYGTPFSRNIIFKLSCLQINLISSIACICFRIWEGM